MTVPDTDEILSIARGRVPEFIRAQADARTLSRLVRRLNRDLLEGDPAARSRAAAALSHLGFFDQPPP